MTVNTLEINLDAKCSACGKGGVIKNQRERLCMECINKRMQTELKKDHLSKQMLQEMAGDIEKLLLEKQKAIEWAFRRVPYGFKISIGLNIEHTVPPTVEYSVSFPLEPAHEPIQKEKTTLKKVIGQTEMDL